MRAAPLVALVVVVACGSTAVPVTPAVPGSDGAPPKSGAPDAAPSTPDAVPASPPEPATCDESRPPQPGVIPLRVEVELTYAGQPLNFGETMAVPGGDFTLNTFRFYVSEVAVMAGTRAVPVNLVDSAGAPVPYNVHLVNPEDPAGMTLRLAAAPGDDYTGISFLLGLSDACDRRDPSTSKPPLTFASQMTWPPPFGFLFLRYAALTTRGLDELPDQIEVGGLPGAVFAPRVTAPGSFRVSASGGTAHLRVAIDQLLAAARMPATPEPLLGPLKGIEAGNAVRQNVGKVSLFSLTAP